MTVWIIGAAAVLIILICLIFMIRHFYDTPACSIMEEEKYRELICDSAHRDFRATLRQILEILDNIQKDVQHPIPYAEGSDYESTNQFYKAGKDIYNKCLQIEKTSREIWSNPKYTKDFYFFVGLHYVSRFQGKILEAERRSLKQFLDDCTQLQKTNQDRITAMRVQRQEAEEFEERRRLGEEIEESTQVVKDLGNLINKFSEVHKVYQDRIKRQELETNKRADFIVTHFKRLGPEWKQTMSVHPRRV